MTAAANAARSALAAGVSVCPPREDGSKAPITTWKAYQEKAAGPLEVEAWYSGDRAGVGVICGAVSGGLELFEFDTADILASYIAAARDAGLGSLLTRVANGYYETTPHGHHLFYRVTDGQVPGNTKLARRPKTPEEMNGPGDKVQVLIETRGSGGFVVVAPSAGKVHPTGLPYVLKRGGWDSLATVTLAERDQLHNLARTFDQPIGGVPTGPVAPHPDRAVLRSPGSQPPVVSDGRPSAVYPADLRPGDDFGERGSIFELLERHGWTYIGLAADGNHQFRRPGKSEGVSATWKDEQFWCWSTSTGFEAERTYTKFGVYTALEAGGDFAEATRKLAAEGYGSSGARDISREPRLRHSTTPAAPRSDSGWRPVPGVRNAVSLSDWLTRAKAGAA